MKTRLGIVVLSFGLAMAASGLASAKVFRMAASEAETIVIDMPDGWIARSPNPAGQPIRTMSFEPSTGRSFKVLLTVLPLPPSPDGRPVPLSDLRESLAVVAEQAKKNSVETSLPTIDLIGPQVGGSYFIATDRAPLPGEFKHLTQGVLGVGRGIVNVTVLANHDVPGGVARLRNQVLEALRAIRLEKRAVSAGT